MYTGGSPSRGSRILVVRLGAMGDIIHTLPAVASLKHSFPGSRLTWVVEPRWAPLLEDNPFVDRRLLFDRGSGGVLWRTWGELRRERFDFAVDFQGLLKSALVACAARADRIFGYHQSHAREPLAALFYSDKIAARSLHAVGRALDLAAGAGASTVVQSFPLPQGQPEGSLPPGPFVLASPLSGWGAKQWPLEYYGQLGAYLRREAGMALVLNGPPAERQKLSGVPDTVTHFSSIEGLIDATRRAIAVVGLDSGPLHLAAALGKPGVALFGPTDPARNGPYGGSLTLLRSPRAVTSYKRLARIDPSMREISPQAVFEALGPHLAQRPHPADCLA
jgi:heptosyltransferase-1